jgi:hypothetical protein
VADNSADQDSRTELELQKYKFELGRIILKASKYKFYNRPNILKASKIPT